MLLLKLSLFLSSIFVFQTGSSDDFFSLKLLDIDNKTFSFTNFSEKKGTVIIILLSDCPASQDYTLTLNRLARKFEKQDIAFAGLFPGNFSTDEELVEFRNRYKIIFPLLKDPHMVLTKKLKASIGPSCFLIDESGTVKYSGRIDDWHFALGKKRQVVKERNLEDAIVSVLKNEPVKISKTNAIGCIIEYE